MGCGMAAACLAVYLHYEGVVYGLWYDYSLFILIMKASSMVCGMTTSLFTLIMKVYCIGCRMTTLLFNLITKL